MGTKKVNVNNSILDDLRNITTVPPSDTGRIEPNFIALEVLELSVSYVVDYIKTMERFVSAKELDRVLPVIDYAIRDTATDSGNSAAYTKAVTVLIRNPLAVLKGSCEALTYLADNARTLCDIVGAPTQALALELGKQKTIALIAAIDRMLTCLDDIGATTRDNARQSAKACKEAAPKLIYNLGRLFTHKW